MSSHWVEKNCVPIAPVLAPKIDASKQTFNKRKLDRLFWPQITHVTKPRWAEWLGSSFILPLRHLHHQWKPIKNIAEGQSKGSKSFPNFTWKLEQMSEKYNWPLLWQFAPLFWLQGFNSTTPTCRAGAMVFRLGGQDPLLGKIIGWANPYFCLFY